MASFAPRPGCPLCSIVSTPYPSLLQSPRSPFFAESGNRNGGAPPASPPQIVHKDDKVTVYLEKKDPVSSKGHLVVVLNLHVPSLYMLSSSDLPLLLHIQNLSQTLLTRHINGTLSGGGPMSPTSPTAQTINFSPETDPTQKFHIGFIVSPFADPKIPVSDHLHCHAYIGSLDLAGWYRKIHYSGMGWWAIDDLIAEIREQSSNNRVKSAYPDRQSAPINRVHDAGARVGLPNGLELPQTSVDGIPTSPTTGSVQVPAVAVQDGDAPVTPKVSAAEEGRSSSYHEEDLATSNSSTALNRLGSAQLKRPMGPRGKDSASSGTIPLSQVGSSSSDVSEEV